MSEIDVTTKHSSNIVQRLTVDDDDHDDDDDDEFFDDDDDDDDDDDYKELRSNKSSMIRVMIKNENFFNVDNAFVIYRQRTVCWFTV